MLNLYLAITKTCNMRCEYCYVPEANKSEKAEEIYAIERSKKLIDKLTAHDAVDTIVFHGAEPTILPAKVLGEIAEYGFSKGVRHFSLQSNGLKLDKEYLDEYEESFNNYNKIPTYSVSIDFPGVMHDKRRGHFDKIKSNLDRMILEGKAVGTLSVVGKDVVDNYLVEFMEEFSEFNKSMEHLPFYNASWKTEYYNPLFTDEDKYKFARSLIDYGLGETGQVMMSNSCEYAGNNCNFLQFDIYGGVYSCNKTYNEGGEFAKWDDETMADILEKRKHLFEDRPTSPECSNCGIQSMCNSGCPVTRQSDGRANDCITRKVLWKEI